MKIIVVIPARGGSKGIPRKNIRLMNGLPLISYVIKTALESSFNPDVNVSTDSEEIADVAIKFGAKGPTLPIVTACATSTHTIGEAYSKGVLTDEDILKIDEVVGVVI